MVIRNGVKFQLDKSENSYFNNIDNKFKDELKQLKSPNTESKKILVNQFII